jgi:hypothetical protein
VVARELKAVPGGIQDIHYTPGKAGVDFRCVVVLVSFGFISLVLFNCFTILSSLCLPFGVEKDQHKKKIYHGAYQAATCMLLHPPAKLLTPKTTAAHPAWRVPALRVYAALRVLHPHTGYDELYRAAQCQYMICQWCL